MGVGLVPLDQPRQPLLQARSGKIEEGAQLDRQQAVARMHQAYRPWRRLELLQQDAQRAGPQRGFDLVGKHTCQPDAGNRRIDGRFGGVDLKP